MLAQRVRQAAGDAYRYLRPSREVAAWRRACRQASRTPRYVPGTIEMAGYRLRYPDLISFCPQWHEIFAKGALRFTAATDAPRIFDCGANVGIASLYFKRLYPRARITAFEADPAVFVMLEENLTSNGVADVELVQAAVWTSNGRLAFRCEGSDSGAVEALQPSLAGTSREVPSVRLRDRLAEEGEVDLLKLDVEGAEFDLVHDCLDVLDRVKAISMELHEFDPARRRTPALLDELSLAGFTYSLTEALSATWRVDPSGPFPGQSPAWLVHVKAWRT
jgi:FkbM family methyltransferase